MQTLLHPTYMPNVLHFSAMLKSKELVFEVCDNYQKQTYRNRCEIYSPNGKLALTVPVNYTQKKRQLYKDVKIANEEKWQSHHLKSLQSAYNMSPFYEFYEDDLMPLFSKNYDFILDFNLNCWELLCQCLQVHIDYTLSEHFESDPFETQDFRSLVSAKRDTSSGLKEYTQVFTEKHGFISNLSLIDLLFNEGPNAVLYLEAHNVTL